MQLTSILNAISCKRQPDTVIMASDTDDTDKDPFLISLGERLKLLRARRGLTRKALAHMADVSERHVANVESGVGNASIQFLRQLSACA